MNINWKDFGLMYILGFAVIFIFAFIGAIFSLLLQELIVPVLIFPQIYILLIYALPLVFYFWRNKSEIKEAIIVPFIFGLTFKFLASVVTIILEYIIIEIDDGTLLIPGVTDWVGLISTLLFYYGILVSIYGLIIWFAINKLKWEKS